MLLLAHVFAALCDSLCPNQTPSAPYIPLNPLPSSLLPPLSHVHKHKHTPTHTHTSQALGGRFSSVMPSDLTKPGALAFESIPARADNSEAYAAPSVKRELARIFKRDGCHHCGEAARVVVALGQQDAALMPSQLRARAGDGAVEPL